MADSFSAIVAAPRFKLGVCMQEGALRELVFLPPDVSPQPAREASAASVVSAVEAYLHDPLYRFDIPLAVRGTTFQRRVWQAITAIPCGQVIHYGALAAACGSHARAVGQACGSNPYPLIVPCHRVTSRQGIGGFAHSKADWLIAAKQWLLCHEGVI